MKNLLRTTALLLIFNSSFLITKAQWVSIPDTAFVSYLQATFPTCMNGNLMDTTCSGIVNAINVSCSHRPIKDLTGIQYFDVLQYLNCSNDSITALPVLPKLLIVLVCDNNKLSTLSGLPNSLIQISCGFNRITSLPNLPNSLEEFQCINNLLTSLPALPNSLTNLDCRSNQLTSLPSLNSLGYLYCDDNPISVLPNLPNSLLLLECQHNQLTSIPALPNGLVSLFAEYNLLTALPNLPSSMLLLYLDSNSLTNLPALPIGLQELHCEINGLTSLPALPTSLTDLRCGANQLISLPTLPNSLTNLQCGSNQLTNIPTLPDSLDYFYCYGNSALNCLPQLKRIVNLDFRYTNITCLPNYGNVTSSHPPLNFVPLCDTFNSNGCSALWNISGNVYHDANSNCSKDVIDSAQRNIRVNLWSGGNIVQQSYTGGEGFYSFDVNGYGAYEISIDTSNIPYYVSCPSNNLRYDSLTAIDSSYYAQDFALKCKTGFDLAAQSIWGTPFRPANYALLNIHAGDVTNIYGVHCAAGTSGSVQLIINGAAHYASAASGALTPTSVANDTITWSIADFGAVNFFHDFNINVATDTTAVLGSQICFTLIVNPIAGDNNPANNILTHCFTVVGSFDPNEKEVYPAGSIDTATHWLTYTIHFQNTGTAEAQHIYVTDTLDSNIDAGSFQLLAYSHQPMVQLKGNNLRFNFPNINLPDSNTNEPLSHGYVQYKVKLKDNLPVGTNINNTAFIYFDFNSPVVTNMVSNTITTATGIADFGFKILDFGLNPNPANELVQLSMDETMVGSIITITDITGREVLHSAVQIRNPQFDIRNLSPGVYFVTLENKTGRLTKKLVKQ